ncbi:MAG: right-handed parallel beta-helix repeat-containing protein [Pseudobdellovibrionaceae bacterium]
MKSLFKLFCTACIQGILTLSQANAATYYVSTSGSDSSSGTSQTAPFRTIRQALSRAQASGDIIYVMTGTYNETVNISQSGITLSAYPNNSPVIDGGTSLPSSDWGYLLLISGNYNKVSGFEVKNCNINGTHVGGFAVWLTGHHNTVSKMNVHHSWENGIIAQGDYSTVEDSMVWQAARQNFNAAGNGWSSGLSAARNHSSAALIPGITSYPTIRRNKVFNNWGEGLSCYEADHCTVEDNIVYDNFTVNLYLSDAGNSVVQRNMIYISSAPAVVIRNNAHSGIGMFDEVSSVPRSHNNKVINNFLYNVDLSSFGWTQVQNSGLKDSLIANNTIVDGNLDVGAGGLVVNSNSQIRNNIVLGRSSYVTSNSGITFSNNNWAVTPSAAASSTNVNGDPQVARAGSTSPGSLTPAYFKISGSSPVINKAMPLSDVGVDFFGASRGSSPDIGGHEYGSTSTAPAPAPAPSTSPTPTSSMPAPTPVPSSPTPTPTPAPAPVPVPTTSTNLIQNSGFESGSTGWNLWQNTYIVGNNAASGTYALRTGTGAGGASYRLSITPVIGGVYTLSASAKLSLSSNLGWIFISCYNSSNVRIADSSVKVQSTSYQTLSTSITVPAGTTYIRVWTWKGAGSGYLYIDNVQVIKK